MTNALSNRNRVAFALGVGATSVAAMVVACSSGGTSGATSSDAGPAASSGNVDGGGAGKPPVDAGAVSTQPGVCTNPTIPIVFSPMFSAFIPGSTAKTFPVPAVTADGNSATWSLSDPTQGHLQLQSFENNGRWCPASSSRWTEPATTRARSRLSPARAAEPAAPRCSRHAEHHRRLEHRQRPLQRWRGAPSGRAGARRASRGAPPRCDRTEASRGFEGGMAGFPRGASAASCPGRPTAAATTRRTGNCVHQLPRPDRDERSVQDGLAHAGANRRLQRHRCAEHHLER